jgi:hypothetical protein
MAISLKNQLEQAQLLKESLRYLAPDLDVTKSGRVDAKTRATATRLFYDFYAMEFLHRYLGKNPYFDELPSSDKAKRSKTMGLDPYSVPWADWSNVVSPQSGIVLPEKLRHVIDDVYEQVTIAISKKLLQHLRLTLVQELRHIIGSAYGWREFRSALVSTYNAKKTISEEEFNKLVASYMPEMVDHKDTVKRLLLFSKYYSKLGTMDNQDPADIVVKKTNKSSSKKTDDKPESPISSPQGDINEPNPSVPLVGDEEPDTTDYSQEIPDYPDYEYPSGEFDIEDPFDKKKKLHEDSYASGRISPSTVRKVNNAINKARLTWEDIVLAYNNIPWSGGYGGPKWGAGVVAFLKLVPEAKVHNIEKMAAMVDHIFDLEHNNGALLNKGGMYIDSKDLDRRAKVTHIARYLPNVSPMIARIIERFMKYLSNNPEYEINMAKFIAAPSKDFTSEQKKELVDRKFQLQNGNFVAYAPFENKKGDSVSRFYTFKQTEDGKFVLYDTIESDARVFDTFEDALKYVDTIKGGFENYLSGSIGQPYVPPQKSAKDLYLDTHTKIKLDADKEKTLFYICKMGWRSKSNSKYYKAYFSDGRRVMLYAFSDGSFMVADNKGLYELCSNWNYALAKCKKETAGASEYPEPADGLAWIGKSDNGVQLNPHQPLTVPSAHHIVPKSKSKHTPIPNLYVHTPLPPVAPGKAVYTAHSGIDKLPSKSIRLTQYDESLLSGFGFKPKMVGQDVWYIHGGCNDSAKFYPNNTAKVLFSSTGTGIKPSLNNTIQKIIDWIAANYTPSTDKSPLITGGASQPVKATTTPKSIKLSSMFELKLNAAGFTWDPTKTLYVDSGNTLSIATNRSSVLMGADGTKFEFPNLPALLGFLTDSYPKLNIDLKKKSNVKDNNQFNSDEIDSITNALLPYPNFKIEPQLWFEGSSADYIEITAVDGRKFQVLKKDGEYRLGSIFKHGVSLLYKDEDFSKFLDYMKGYFHSVDMEIEDGKNQGTSNSTTYKMPTFKEAFGNYGFVYNKALGEKMDTDVYVHNQPPYGEILVYPNGEFRFIGIDGDAYQFTSVGSLMTFLEQHYGNESNSKIAPPDNHEASQHAILQTLVKHGFVHIGQNSNAEQIYEKKGTGDRIVVNKDGTFVFHSINPLPSSTPNNNIHLIKFSGLVAIDKYLSRSAEEPDEPSTTEKLKPSNFNYVKACEEQGIDKDTSIQLTEHDEKIMETAGFEFVAEGGVNLFRNQDKDVVIFYGSGKMVIYKHEQPSSKGQWYGIYEGLSHIIKTHILHGEMGGASHSWLLSKGFNYDSDHNLYIKSKIFFQIIK